MSELRAAGVILLFFALRCIVPLVITAAIAFFMNRLVDRWEAEEAALKAAPTVTPEKGQTATAVKKAPCNLTCWLVRSCDQQKRANCPAYLEPTLPCWIARMLAEGALPESCSDCQVYDSKLAIG